MSLDLLLRQETFKKLNTEIKSYGLDPGKYMAHFLNYEQRLQHRENKKSRTLETHRAYTFPQSVGEHAYDVYSRWLGMKYGRR